jgi:hypothetical protein
MPNKTKRKSRLSADVTKLKQLTDKVRSLELRNSKKKKKSTPFADTGGIAGRAVGTFFGNSGIGQSVGRWLGTGIGSIFGSGDYTMVGQVPNYNVLTNSKQIPQFTTTAQTNIVCHREYLGDILGTSAFSNSQYPLNPGLAKTFPWLSTVAENYQEYKFHGIAFEFRPLITDFVTNGAPGVIVMATNYNADAPIYVNKQQMENSEFAVSVKPTNALLHGVECEMGQTILPQRYVRTGAVPLGQDLRLYDYGNFQLATQSNPTQNLGELWVTYCVEFFKPILPVTAGGNILSAHLYKSNISSASPLGTILVSSSGSLNVITTGTTITFNALPSTQYLVNLIWYATAGPFAGPGTSISGDVTRANIFNAQVPQDFARAPSPGTTTSMFMNSTILVAGTTGGAISYILATSGTFPAPSTLDIFITELDSTVV